MTPRMPSKPAPRMAPKRKPATAVQADDLGMGPMTLMPPMPMRKAPPKAAKPLAKIPPKMRGR